MSRKDEAYAYIKKAIISGELKAEMPILENELSEKLHMSRTPIREALRELEAQGVVVNYASRGAFVTALTPDDVEDIFELRLLFELRAVQQGINRMKFDELEKLRHDLENAEELDDWDECYKADQNLHNYIIEKSGSRRLMMFTKALNTQIERISYRASLDEEHNRNTFQEHMQIIDALEEKDLQKSQRVLGDHLKLVAQVAIERAKLM